MKKTLYKKDNVVRTLTSKAEVDKFVGLGYEEVKEKEAPKKKVVKKKKAKED